MANLGAKWTLGSTDLAPPFDWEPLHGGPERDVRGFPSENTFHQLGRERADLKAQTAALSSQLSSAASAPRIQRLAAKQLGLVQASPDQMHYLTLRR